MTSVDKVENSLKEKVKSLGSIERVAKQLLRDVWALEELLSESKEERKELRKQVSIVRSAVLKY